MTWDRTIQPDPATYDSYCWFIYPAISVDGESLGTTRTLFPPVGREDTYGGMNRLQILKLARDRLSELEYKYGVGNVKVEMVGDCSECDTAETFIWFYELITLGLTEVLWQCPDCVDNPRGWCDSHIPVEDLCKKHDCCEDCLHCEACHNECDHPNCRYGRKNNSKD